MVSKFLSTVGSLLNKNLTYMHQVFDNEDLMAEEDEDKSPGRRLSTL